MKDAVVSEEQTSDRYESTFSGGLWRSAFTSSDDTLLWAGLVDEIERRGG